MARLPFAQETRFEESAAAAVQNEIATALRGRETRCVLELDGDVDTRDLVDRVVRFLSVEMRKRMLSRRADAAAQDAAVAVANAAQRDYLHAASHAMAFAIRRRCGVGPLMIRAAVLPRAATRTRVRVSCPSPRTRVPNTKPRVFHTQQFS